MQQLLLVTAMVLVVVVLLLLLLMAVRLALQQLQVRLQCHTDARSTMWTAGQRRQGPCRS